MEDDVVALLGGEADGIVIPFFDLLWKRKNDKQEKQCQYPNFRVNIPDTIVYNFSKPQYWYFTSRNRDDLRIKKKKRQNLNSKTILEQFLPPRSASGIAAAYMWTNEGTVPAMLHAAATTTTAITTTNSTTNTTNSAGAAVAGTHTSGGAGQQLQGPRGKQQQQQQQQQSQHAPYCIRYMDADGLRANLLRLGQISDNGVLQMFVDPKPSVDGSLHHNVIQTHWQPNHISFERRQNKHQLTDARLPFQTRAETFDGTFEHSESFPLMSAIILEEIKTINNMIAEHLWFVADCTVKRMILNFKIDANNKVWLLFCSGISVVQRDTVARNPVDLLQSVGPAKAYPRDAEQQQQQQQQQQQHHRSSVVAGSAAAPEKDRSRSSSMRRGDQLLPSLPQSSMSLHHLLRSPSRSTTNTTTNWGRGGVYAIGTTTTNDSGGDGGVAEVGRRASRLARPTAEAALVLPGTDKRKHSSYLRETFSDESWGGPANEAIKRILFDSKNLLSPSQR